MTQVLDEERVERAADAMRKRRAELQHAPLDRIYSELFAAAISAYLGETHVVVPMDDYARLLQSTEADDMITRCETCGAWLDLADPATASTEDYTGCWKVAAGEDSNRCKSYRALPTLQREHRK